MEVSIPGALSRFQERRAIELERDELQDSCEHTKKELNEVGGPHAEDETP